MVGIKLNVLVVVPLERCCSIFRPGWGPIRSSFLNQVILGSGFPPEEMQLSMCSWPSRAVAELVTIVGGCGGTVKWAGSLVFESG